MQSRRDLNVIGAFVTALNDAVRLQLEDLSGSNETSAAALILMHQQPGISPDQLGRVLNLSQSGAVRLVDRLEADRLVLRRPGTDRRSRALKLTDTGERQVKALLMGRERALAQALKVLETGELIALVELAEKVLKGLGGTDLERAQRCRLCDTEHCPEATCPIGA